MAVPNLAVWAHCWVRAHAAAHAWDPFLGAWRAGQPPLLFFLSFAAVLSAPLWVRFCGFRTRTGGGIMRELQGEWRLALGARLSLI